MYVKSSYRTTPKLHTSEATENLLSVRDSGAYLQYTEIIWKMSYLSDNSSYWRGQQTNKWQTLPGDTEGIGTSGWGYPQKGSCAMLTLGWKWELKLQGLCVCVWGVGVWDVAVYTHKATHLVCAFFLESWILLHTKQMVPMKLVTINTGAGVPLTDMDIHCCLHCWGMGSLQACALTSRTFHLLSPTMSTVKCWVVGTPNESENLVLRPSDIEKSKRINFCSCWQHWVLTEKFF